jgi:hypothetical protein
MSRDTRSKAQIRLEELYLDKEVFVVLRDIPERRGHPMVKSKPILATVTCVCDNSADIEGDRRRRSTPTGRVMVRLHQQSADLEYEAFITDLVLVPVTPFPNA